jgi:hypothetical protein
MALAQTKSGYGYFGVGQFRCCEWSRTGVNFGGGAKFLAKNGLGVGADLGVIWPRGEWNEKVTLLSFNGYYGINTKNKKFMPFVTGGYTRGFTQGIFILDGNKNFFNFGGGFDYWFNKKVGLMAEFRDHITKVESHTFQIWALRFGVVFGKRELQ